MHSNNSKYRRALERLPTEMKEILSSLTKAFVLLSYRPGGPGWVTELEVAGRKFLVTCEYHGLLLGIEENGVYESVNIGAPGLSSDPRAIAAAIQNLVA